ncbi:N-acetylmuramoyl-L-alanine amidase [Bacillus sp. RG28]|uniref:N-acetylmuramoyl-L-alanine amidase n=1 Tax=Gottfriedia endophytica TaxID=2820819 RepID=A0A940NNQ2_9BACI|nr:N-acetylmuramoyl-L-alanine amidase [Gottfriedia endophytica]MBP0725519.1 N-acetylmuramoyl-L-alanine amidase [Gottfriedia endophytica]
MSNWRNDFVQKNKYTRPGTLLNSVKKIVLHWTANPGSSAANHQKYFNGTCIHEQRAASAHIFVDDNEAVCIVPLNEVAYHANGNNEMVNGVPYRGVPEIAPNANLKSIGVEMCVQKDGTISQATINRTVDVFVELCKMYKLTENDIVRHYDVTHKDCPSPFVNNGKLFEDFKKSIGALLRPNEIDVKTDKPEYPGIVKSGDKGGLVKLLQRRLGINETGIFDSNTVKAVKSFQTKNGLVPDSVVGKLTWGKMF